MFLASKTYDKQLTIEKQDSLIRFGHEEALLLKKRHKTAIFSALHKLTNILMKNAKPILNEIKCIEL